jgi:hypothetical protein
MAPFGWIVLILCAMALYKRPNDVSLRGVVIFVLLFIGVLGLLGPIPKGYCEHNPGECLPYEF